MVAGLKDANSYIAEMGAESRPADGDIEAAVAALVAEIEAEFTPEHLNTFVATGGFDPNTEGATADEAAAAAAEADDALAIDPNA
jgi:hypothetical protein